MSTYVNKVDRKGRVSVPATFRATLNDQSFEGIVAFPSLEYDALEATGIDTMEAISAGLAEIEQNVEEQGVCPPILPPPPPPPPPPANVLAPPPDVSAPTP